MSRYSIPLEGNIKIVVGYDPPLETYFAQMYDYANPDDEQVTYLCGGLPTDKITTVEALEKRIQEHCKISPDMRIMLQRDKEEASEPSPLQRRMRKIFE